MESSGTKTCIVCKQDCTAKPRIKDSQGRYCCKDCADRKLAAKAPAASAVPAAVADVPEDEPLSSLDLLAEEAKATGNIASDRVIDLSPPDPDLLPAEKRGKVPNLRHSGLDTSRLKPGNCAKCGYDLKGLESLRCPECGAICRPKDKLDYLREDSRRLVRNTWLAPIIIIAACLIFSFIILLGSKASLGDFILIYLSCVINIPVGLLALWLCTLMFLDIDAPWGLTILRYSAVQSVSPLIAAVMFALTGVSLNLVGGGLGLFISAYLYSWLLDVEKWDAFWFAVIQRIVEVCFFLGLAYVIGSMMGP